MKILQSALALITFFAITLTAPVAAQTYKLQPASKLTIDGTSTKSDWTVSAESFTADLTVSESSSAPTVSAVKLTVPAEKIVSNKSGIMDRLIQDALKVEEHKQITYALVSATPAGDPLSLKTKGRLTLGGVTKDVEVLVKGEHRNDGTLRFTGTTPLKMTDYGLTPPTAMFGALRTANDVTVNFDLVFAPAK